jgi:hypothetical protein
MVARAVQVVEAEGTPDNPALTERSEAAAMVGRLRRTRLLWWRWWWRRWIVVHRV